MDNPAKGIVLGQKSPSRELAELSYYENPRTELASEGKPKRIIPFEELLEEECSQYLEQAKAFLLRLNKLNLTVVSIADVQEKKQSEQKNLEILTEIITQFVNKLNTTRPALFPSLELAHVILAGGK